MVDHAKYACVYCGTALQPGVRALVGHRPTLDRLRPAMGYVAGNVVLACWRCNRRKSDWSLEELEVLVVKLRQLVEQG
jgi:5-methylcytosine-specific restriction endonuclease McrA